MNTAIIGASSAGLYIALLLKLKHPDESIVVFDKNEKIGRKIYATGNGRCNLLNLNLLPDDYNNPSYLKPILAKYPFEKLVGVLTSLGIEVTSEGDYVYPLSLSSSSFVSLLSKKALSLGIEFRLEIRLLDYLCDKGITLKTDSGDFHFDRVVFCSGGKSYPTLGSDGSLFAVFEQHGYSIVPLRPALCPIKTKEKVKTISGLRHEAKVTLLIDGRLIHEEIGEILFKDDGLSGIAIFNTESKIVHFPSFREAIIILDMFPAMPLSALAERLSADSKLNAGFFLEAILPGDLADFVLRRAGLPKKDAYSQNEILNLARTLKKLDFTYADHYPFASSQVSSGGVSLNDVKASLASRHEANVFFAGEVLDVDGLCGGYNLTWALLSAIIVSENI